MCIITMYHDLKSRNLMHVVYYEQRIFFQYILYRCAHHDMIHTHFFLVCGVIRIQNKCSCLKIFNQEGNLNLTFSCSDSLSVVDQDTNEIM